MLASSVTSKRTALKPFLRSCSSTLSFLIVLMTWKPRLRDQLSLAFLSPKRIFVILGPMSTHLVLPEILGQRVPNAAWRVAMIRIWCQWWGVRTMRMPGLWIGVEGCSTYPVIRTVFFLDCESGICTHRARNVFRSEKWFISDVPNMFG